MQTSLFRLHRRGDRIMLAVVWVMQIVSLSIASWYDTWTLSLTVGLGLSILSSVVVTVASASRLARVTNAAVFMGFSALLIHQSHGMIEMHFGIFVLLAFLLFYRDWLPLVAAAGLIAVHHLAFHLLQSAGAPIFVFPHVCGIGVVLVHAGFVVFETALLIYMAVLSQQEAQLADEVSSLGSRITADGEIDLRFSEGSSSGAAAHGIQNFLFAIANAIHGVRSVAHQVHAASESLTQVTEQIRTTSEGTSAQAKVASIAADQVSGNVTTVATGSEEMQTSIREISQSAVEANRVAQNAVSAAENANQIIHKLSSSSTEIGEVIKVITDIAQQTNLLALNATIEAARAGEAGSGFAVVANEVKELARETARATEEIGVKIGAIQVDAKSAVQAIAEISAVIDQVNGISGIIASAVEEQRANTSEIGRNVNEAATGTREIARNIANVAQAAVDTSAGALQTQQAARSLNEIAAQLQAVVGGFKLQEQSTRPAGTSRQAAKGDAPRNRQTVENAPWQADDRNTHSNQQSDMHV